MARYLLQVSYTDESWATQVRTQANVVERIEPLLAACHGTLDSIYYAFGDCDVVALIDFAKPEDAAAFSITITAGGAVKSAQTTPLLTVEQGMAALKRAADATGTYHPPTTIEIPAQGKQAARR